MILETKSNSKSKKEVCVTCALNLVCATQLQVLKVEYCRNSHRVVAIFVEVPAGRITGTTWIFPWQSWQHGAAGTFGAARLLYHGLLPLVPSGCPVRAHCNALSIGKSGCRCEGSRCYPGLANPLNTLNTAGEEERAK